MEKKRFSNIGIITGITFLLMVSLNALANIIPINGQNTGEVSDSYVNLFTPSAYAFSIWGLIYLLLGLYTLYQLGFFRKNELEEKEKLFSNIGVLFSISSIASGLWILAWHYNFMGISTILIITVLICLILINANIKKWKLSFKDRLFIRIPFSIYFGWITVATIANITVFLVSISWNGFGIAENIWAKIILLVGLLIGGISIIKNRDIYYGLVIAWAYTAIYVKHISEAGWNGAYPLVSTTAIVCVVLLFVIMAYTIFKKRKRGLILD